MMPGCRDDDLDARVGQAPGEPAGVDDQGELGPRVGGDRRVATLEVEVVEVEAWRTGASPTHVDDAGPGLVGGRGRSSAVSATGAR